MERVGTSLPTIAQVQEAVAREFEVPLWTMREPDGSRGSRTRERAHPRQVAIALSVLLTERHLTVIGKHFGGRDHSTVKASCRAVAERRRKDAGLHQRMRRVSFALVGRQAR